nr:hypothetical protein [Clostridium collagenovorans]
MIPINKNIYPIGIKKKNGSISIPLGEIVAPDISEMIKQHIPNINGKT